MDPIDDMAQSFTDHSQHAFIKSAGAVFLGAIVGSMLNNTRFGQWFNTSRFIGAIIGLVKLAVIILGIYFVYCVIKVW